MLQRDCPVAFFKVHQLHLPVKSLVVCLYPQSQLTGCKHDKQAGTIAMVHVFLLLGSAPALLIGRRLLPLLRNRHEDLLTEHGEDF